MGRGEEDVEGGERRRTRGGGGGREEKEEEEEEEEEEGKERSESISEGTVEKGPPLFSNPFTTNSPQNECLVFC